MMNRIKGEEEEEGEEKEEKKEIETSQGIDRTERERRPNMFLTGANTKLFPMWNLT